MTIPIQPGPFSFLAPLGQALGNYAQIKEQNRQEALKEANDRAKNYLALRLAGLMKPKDFESPEIQAVFHAAGYGPVSPDATPDELYRQMKGDYLQGLINPSMAKPMTDESRAVVGAPERGLSEGIDAKIAKSKAEVPVAGLQGAQAQAALPGAGLTVQTEQQQSQDKTFNDLADRYIEGLYAQTHKLPASGADAFQAALADPKQGQFAQAAGQSYFDQAIERLRAKLADEATKRAAAQARLAGASGTGFDDLAKIYQNQQTRATAQLNALEKPTSTDRMMAGVAAQQRARGKTPSPLMVQAEQRVQQYDAQAKALNDEIAGYRDQLTKLPGMQLGQPQPPPPSRSKETQQQKWDAAAAFIKNDKTGKYKGKTPEQVLGPRP